VDLQKELARQKIVTQSVPPPRKEAGVAKKAWSEKAAVKEKREVRREKRKMIKNKLRRDHAEERIKEIGEMEEELEKDWKELAREKKRAKMDKGRHRKVDNNKVSFDL